MSDTFPFLKPPSSICPKNVNVHKAQDNYKTLEVQRLYLDRLK